jgi:glycosyltransferase involved in cell wall biosynthesis
MENTEGGKKISYMRILQIHNKYLEKGGEDTVTSNERIMLQENGHEVQLCEFDNQDLEGLSSFSLLYKTIFNQNSYRKVIAQIESFKPDIVHIHNVYYEASSAIFWAIKRKNIPAVMTIHNYRLGCIQGLLFRNNAICQLCLDKKTAFYGIKHKCFQNSYLKSLQVVLVNVVNKFVIRYMNPITKFIFLAEFTKDVMSPLLFLKNTEGVVKPNYVNDFGYTQMSEREDFYLFIGRLNEQKGLKILLHTFIKNKKRLDVIGGGLLDEYVKKIAQTYPNIHFWGIANKALVIERLKKSKALIVPSITYEGQPMTVLEAFSTGTPVLAANTKNLDTLISNGENGFLFEPNDMDIVLEDFEKLGISDKLKIYSKARETYEKKYSSVRNYQQLMHIYKTVLNCNNEFEELPYPLPNIGNQKQKQL